MRSIHRYSLVPLLLLLAAWGGCTSNPMKTANTATVDNKPETIAFASYGLFVIAEEAAADIKEMSGTPQEVKDGLKEADRVASVGMESIHDLALTIKGLRDVVAAGGEGAEALPEKIDELNKLMTETAPKVQKFTDAINKAKESSP
jgi:hypothetical protein